MDHLTREANPSPFVVRAQVLIQNYMCFVYLPGFFFHVLSKKAASGSVARRCATFLTDDQIRYFRNAVAHANWSYREDFGALAYWSRKGSSRDDPLFKFEVTNEELEFWQALSRCVAYAALSNLN